MRNKKGKELDDLLSKLIPFIRDVLIAQVGDSRECPHCLKIFIPDDKTAHDAFELFKELE